jgi:hypothetical protein
LTKRCFRLSLLAVVTSATWGAEAPKPTGLELLAKALTRPVAIIQGKTQAFTATLTATYQEGELKQAVELTIARADAQRFRLSLKSELLSFTLLRDADATLLVVPSQKVAVQGKGPLPAESDLQPQRLFPRLAAAWPPFQTAVGVMQTAEPAAVVLLLQMMLGLQQVPDKPAPTFTAQRAMGGGALSIELTPDGQAIRQFGWRGEGREIAIGLALSDEAVLTPPASLEGLKVLDVPRDELERMVGRALGRAAEVLSQEQGATKVRPELRTAGRGRLAIRKDGRVAMLQGNAYEIGFQHGKLLAAETRRVVDSTLYMAGLFYTIQKKEWFLDTLRGAYQRLQPHVPQEYIEEINGLADGSGLSTEEARLTTMFPELFHCSGFALFGKATAGGRLYHGRVLDYMTEIGLQREAVVFVVKKDKAIPFANVGYAGFIGSVSGMNAEKVAFGEMGGRGEGLWDGTPMAFLMRIGLERARTLDDAIRIFREAKRTCEYYYVISDGKGPSAIGVGATPDEIVFIQPGQAHPKLPTPIEDAVLMSAGDRYRNLVEAVKKKYGQIGEPAAIELMRRPIAMRSNLHNVLFVPEDLVFHVANARGRKPACDEPYTRYDLKALLAEMAKPPEEMKKR